MNWFVTKYPKPCMVEAFTSGPSSSIHWDAEAPRLVGTLQRPSYSYGPLLAGECTVGGAFLAFVRIPK